MTSPSPLPDLLGLVTPPAADEVRRVDASSSTQHPAIAQALRAANMSVDAPADAKVQTLVLELVMRGMQFDEIARVAGLTEVAVEKLASSKWFENEVERRAREGDVPEDSLRSLMRVVAFRAAVRLGKLVNSTTEHVALGAARCALEYTLAPMKLVDAKRSSEMPDVEGAKREAERLQKELVSLARKRTTI